jgi:hypothetical protein
MKPFIINPSIRRAMQNNLLTSEADIIRLANFGTQLVIATQFQSHVATNLGITAMQILQQFLNDYLGVYENISVDFRNQPTIRLATQVGSSSQDGMQLSFNALSAKLTRLTSIFDVTTFSNAKEWIL